MVEWSRGRALVMRARGAMSVAVGALVVAIGMSNMRGGRCVSTSGSNDLLLLLIPTGAAAGFSAGGGATELKIAGGGHTDEGVRM